MVAERGSGVAPVVVLVVATASVAATLPRPVRHGNQRSRPGASHPASLCQCSPCCTASGSTLARPNSRNTICSLLSMRSSGSSPRVLKVPQSLVLRGSAVDLSKMLGLVCARPWPKPPPAPVPRRAFGPRPCPVSASQAVDLRGNAVAAGRVGRRWHSSVAACPRGGDAAKALSLDAGSTGACFCSQAAAHGRCQADRSWTNRAGATCSCRWFRQQDHVHGFHPAQV